MSFKDILGQNRQIGIIKKVVENGRVPHAYLFVGEEGVGKMFTALNMAKALNCDIETADSCDVCMSCKKIDKGNHPDVDIIEPEGNFIKINQIRELQKSLQYKPYEGKKKACIIPDAAKMNLAAANSLLKTLEEPSPDTILILITTSPHLLLPTINSRCQKLKFQPLSRNSISQIVKDKLGKKEDAASMIASLARGSLKRAYELAEGTTIEYRKRLIDKINSLSSNDINNTFKLAEEMSKEKDKLSGNLDLLKTWFRDILVFKEGCPSERLINIDFLEEIKRVAGKFTIMDLLERLKVINDAQSALLWNSNKRLTMEVMLTSLCKN